jgi:multiple sugar transport system permease protein
MTSAELAVNTIAPAPRPMRVKQPRFTIPVWAKAWIALIIPLIFLLSFTLYPIINTILISLIENFQWQSGAGSFAISNFIIQLQRSQGIGLNEWDLFPFAPVFSLGNFLKVWQDPVFIKAMTNTAILVFVSVPLTISISLLIAVSLNSIKRLKGFYQTIFFLPYVTNSIALGMVFNVMFSSDPGGLMNQFLSIFGVSQQAWIYTRDFFIDGESVRLFATQFSMGVAITAFTIWDGLAFKILVFMAGLATIDKQYYDAARIDGAKRNKIFWKITVPLLSPQIFYITITSFIGAFKAYSSVISIFGAGPTNFGGPTGDVWITLVGYVYYYQSLKLPQAAAASVTLLLLILMITAVQVRVGTRRVHY